jgi:hypothetical protein
MRILPVAAVLLAAAAPVAAAAPNRATTSPCTVTVSSPAAPQTKTDRPPKFPAAVVEDLRLELKLSSSTYDGLAAGEHVAELRVFTPRGRLYQSLEVRFTKVGAQPTLAAVLPVAGTSIVQNSVYGDWRVEARLDGAAAVCGSAAAFTIQP